MASNCRSTLTPMFLMPTLKQCSRHFLLGSIGRRRTDDADIFRLLSCREHAVPRISAATKRISHPRRWGVADDFTLRFVREAVDIVSADTPVMSVRHKTRFHDLRLRFHVLVGVLNARFKIVLIIHVEGKAIR